MIELLENLKRHPIVVGASFATGMAFMATALDLFSRDSLTIRQLESEASSMTNRLTESTNRFTESENARAGLNDKVSQLESQVRILGIELEQAKRTQTTPPTVDSAALEELKKERDQYKRQAERERKKWFEIEMDLPKWLHLEQELLRLTTFEVSLKAYEKWWSGPKELLQLEYDPMLNYVKVRYEDHLGKHYYDELPLKREASLKAHRSKLTLVGFDTEYARVRVANQYQPIPTN